MPSGGQKGRAYRHDIEHVRVVAVDISGIELRPAPTEQGALRETFVRRMKRVLLLRFYTDALLSANDRRLLDHAVFSTYCDCDGLGAGDEARRLLEEARAGRGLFRRPVAAGPETLALP